MLLFDLRRFGDSVTRPTGGLRQSPATFPVGVVLWRGRLPLGITPASRFDGRTLPASRRGGLLGGMLSANMIPLDGGCPVTANGDADTNSRLTPDAHSFVRGIAYAAAAQGGVSLTSEQAMIGGDGFVSATGNSERPAVYQHEQSYEQQGFFAWERGNPPPRRRRGA